MKLTSVYFNYPSLTSLKKIKPKDRILFIQQKFQHNVKRVESILGSDLVEIIGTKKKPIGIRVKTNTKTLNRIKKLSFIDLGFLKKKSTDTQKLESYFCFKAIFQIQIEGKRKGNQTIEERFILIQSSTKEKAKKKVTKNCKNDEKPYVNSFGQFVRWTLVELEEPYISYLPIKCNFKNPLEVFSELKGRRVRKDNFWNGK